MFTVVSVLVCALIITVFFAFQSSPIDNSVDNVNLRIKGIDRFVTDTDAYVSEITYVSGRTALNFTVDRMIYHNRFLNNYTEQFRRCLMTGNITIPGVVGNVSCPSEAYLKGKFDNFTSFANNNLNFQSNITLNNITLVQENPWSVVVLVNYTVFVNDSYAVWNETRVSKSYISISGLKDPTFAIFNATNPMSAFRQTNQIINFSDVEYWNSMPSTAHNVIINGSYFAWSGGPSYIERLEGIKTMDVGNFSGTRGGSCVSGIGRCGIVSIISVNRKHAYSVADTPIRSSLDFEFWTNRQVMDTPTLYIRYNFWKTSNYDTSRETFGVTPLNANNGLNGTFFPADRNLAVLINMTDPYYYDGYVVIE